MPTNSEQSGTLQQVSEFAPAKINLCLHVTGRRSDGYHLIDSLVVFADAGDNLIFRKSSEFSLHISGPMAEGLSNGNDNLVLRAARAVQGASDVKGAEITLDKHLPSASGIGGGSADAAATLRGLQNLYGLNELEPLDLALKLGADVPVCCFGRAARMSGIGERIEPITQFPECAAVLVNARVEVSTGAVFSGLDLPNDIAGTKSLDELPAGGFRSSLEAAAWLSRQRNDLQSCAEKLAPVISESLNVLKRTPDCLLARMSGSGATCFGLYEDVAASNIAASQISDAHPQWWVKPVILS